MKITFIDHGREPKCKPNPAYPKGIDVDMSLGAKMTCLTAVPYPAPRCGMMLIECDRCGLRVGVTVAGRVDDPRSVKVACRDYTNAAEQALHS